MITNRRLTAAALTAVGLLTLTGCFGDPAPTHTVNAVNQGSNDNNSLATHFQNVKNPFLTQDPSDPLEQKNLAKRLTYFNSAGSTGYVYLLAPNTSQVIGYYVISGKVSSTGSQLTSTQAITHCMSGSSQDGGSCAVTDAMGDDGSYGPEEGGPAGVFFFTTAGTLIETVMPWVYSSHPIKLYANAPQLDAAAK
jgi:hypothetical protein